MTKNIENFLQNVFNISNEQHNQSADTVFSILVAVDFSFWIRSRFAGIVTIFYFSWPLSRFLHQLHRTADTLYKRYDWPKKKVITVIILLHRCYPPPPPHTHTVGIVVSVNAFTHFTLFTCCDKKIEQRQHFIYLIKYFEYFPFCRSIWSMK